MNLSDFEGTLVEMEFGSHLYGLSTPKSDHDFVGVYMPTLQDVIMKRDQNTIDFNTNTTTKNGPEDVDRKFYSLWKFIDGCKKGNTDVLDMLHSDEKNIIKKTPAWDKIVSVRHMAYTKNMKSFVGYLRTQANKYGVKGSRIACVRKALKVCDSVRNKQDLLGEYAAFLPTGEFLQFETTDHPSTGEQHFYVVCGRKYQDTVTIEHFEENLNKLLSQYGHRAKAAEENDGVDWKAVSHALRVGYQTRALFVHGSYSFPLEESEFILKVKLGQTTMQEVRPELDAIVEEIEMLSQVSQFPAFVDTVFWDNLFWEIVAGEYNLETK